MLYVSLQRFEESKSAQKMKTKTQKQKSKYSFPSRMQHFAIPI